MNSLVSFSKIRKSFDQKKVIYDLDLEVKKNLVTVIVGPNGVGKTTLINILLGILEKDSGKIIFDGNVINGKMKIEEKKRVCYLPDSSFFLDYLSGVENLEYISQIYHSCVDSNLINKLMNEYQLDARSKTCVKNYSRGMKTKLGLCYIELTNAELIVLDEPTVGLDIISSEFLQNRTLSLKKEKNFFIKSHEIEFIRNVSDEICVLVNGKCGKVFSDKEKNLLCDIDILTSRLFTVEGREMNK